VNNVQVHRLDFFVVCLCVLKFTSFSLFTFVNLFKMKEFSVKAAASDSNGVFRSLDILLKICQLLLLIFRYLIADA
jgi:hypothetical protein